MNEIDKIELRSEKVRKIIGDIPSGFIRYGISIITLVLILIGIALWESIQKHLFYIHCSYPNKKVFRSLSKHHHLKQAVCIMLHLIIQDATNVPGIKRLCHNAHPLLF